MTTRPEMWRKKDNDIVIVEAVRLTEDNIEAMAAWCRSDLVDEIDPEDPLETQKGINVYTIDGTKRASLGMYLVKWGSHFYVAHNRQFETVYEPVLRPSPPLESAGDARKALGFADPFDRGRMF